MSKTTEKTIKAIPKKKTGLSFEKAVKVIQKKFDSKSVVTHNEKLKDRVGNTRQYDVVVRGEFGGRSILGVIECKDHVRKVGPNLIEAFSKKTENLGANLKVLVSRKGFTKQALKLAVHENIGCLSLLPDDPEQTGFSVGEMWFGIIKIWSNFKLGIRHNPNISIPPFNSNSLKINDKLIINWFVRSLFTNYSEETLEGQHQLEIRFKKPKKILIDDCEYLINSVYCLADRQYKKKKKWMYWSGDAFYDWNTESVKVPPKGMVVTNSFESDLNTWDDFDGEIPKKIDNENPGFCRATLTMQQSWDDAKNKEVPALTGFDIFHTPPSKV